MAKKSHNPAEAYRKQLKAKELKKNKEARQKARETQTVKKDTRELETEIRSLKAESMSSDPFFSCVACRASSSLLYHCADNPANKKKIQELESELKYVSKLKEKYVSEHPEEHDRVYNIRRKAEQQDQDGQGEGSGQQLYDERGRLRDPKKSVYYDPVYNPFGVPPPGMPYRERTAEEGESEDDESDDEIVMPEGPPPDSDEEGDSDDSDDSDDIPLPEGPPPKPQIALPVPPLPSGPPLPPNGSGFFMPPTGYQPPHHFAYGVPPPPPTSFRPAMPPRPHAPNIAHNRPPVPVQDPLSNKPTIPYQAHKMAHALPIRPSVPDGIDISTSASPKPIPVAASSEAKAPVTQSAGGSGLSAEISAAPVLRDLRKETTAFVPRGVRRRKAGPGVSSNGAGGMTVNAAPGAGEIDEDGDEIKRPKLAEGEGLLGKLSGVLGGAQGVLGKNGSEEKRDVDDDYQKFLEGLGDIG
ncbi:hypothetical protein C343_00322 [Cryptococcus neoformans C23]|nr:hypothetical protein C343_00322 [Cryptococcus neoformans var. grubii C23]OXC87384.1 hypothetical protein C344_00334 [Cryptococcus neoformans var. grubii AD1-7a]OXG41636.1 hypothetical protein C359_03047 [Cryptococcus neoformans var. grubii Bt120]OXG54964.1 hypothetical protein C355_00316 [Cryptococcus neoformans var. grubii Th84]OXH19560.1 hypothetical protein J010_00300 [Cryptococcus neoformans var. grubii]